MVTPGDSHILCTERVRVHRHRQRAVFGAHSLLLYIRKEMDVYEMKDERDMRENLCIYHRKEFVFLM